MQVIFTPVLGFLKDTNDQWTHNINEAMILHPEDPIVNTGRALSRLFYKRDYKLLSKIELISMLSTIISRKNPQEICRIINKMNPLINLRCMFSTVDNEIIFIDSFMSHYTIYELAKPINNLLSSTTHTVLDLWANQLIPGYFYLYSNNTKNHHFFNTGPDNSESFRAINSPSVSLKDSPGITHDIKIIH